MGRSAGNDIWSGGRIWSCIDAGNTRASQAVQAQHRDGAIGHANARQTVTVESRKSQMMKVELRKYKVLLANKQTELAGRINNRDGIAMEKTADALDEVQFAGERELAIHNLDRESTLLRRVRAAQERLTGGTFGDCLHCEAAI